jgi:hypothetical protein
MSPDETFHWDRPKNFVMSSSCIPVHPFVDIEHESRQISAGLELRYCLACFFRSAKGLGIHNFGMLLLYVFLIFRVNAPSFRRLDKLSH